MTPAKDTEMGLMYRPTRNTDHNAWLVRTKQTAAEYAAKLRGKVTNLTGRQCFLLATVKSDPTVVLFTRHSRGIDSFSGKFEITEKVLLPADYPLRAIKGKPGYVRRGGE